MGQRDAGDGELTVNQAIIRYFVPSVCGAAMLLGAFVGTEVIQTVRQSSSDIAALKTDMAVVKNDIKYILKSEPRK